jgi:hypothetical protein
MTKKSLQNWFLTAILFFILLVGIGIFISIIDKSSNRLIFSTFKDLMPLMIAIPTAWLGYCLQRRLSYLQSLRSVWSKLVEAIQYATNYMFLENPTQADHSTAQTKMSVVIDEVRSLFMNLYKKDYSPGLYPFEPLKKIHELLEKEGFGSNFDKKHAVESREAIFKLWKQVRDELLKEFDREVPTFPVSLWEMAENDEKKQVV